MTSTSAVPSASPTPAHASASDARPRTHPPRSTAAVRLTSVAALVAPVLMAASTVAYVIGDEGFEQGQAGGVLMIWSAIAYAIALPGLARVLEHRSTGGFVFASIAGVVGSVGTALYAFDGIHLSASGASVADLDTATVPLALRIPGLFFPLTLLVLGVLLVRHHVVPLAAGALLAVAGLLFPVSRIGDLAALALGVDVLALVGLALIVRAIGPEVD